MKVRSLVGLSALLLVCMSCGGGGGGAKQAVQVQPTVVPLTVQTTALGIGIFGTAYQDHIVVQGGTSPYHFSAQGSLPDGTQLATDGNISGTPTSVGTFTFSVTASDSATPSQSITRPFAISIGAKQSFRNDFVFAANNIPCCGMIHASFSPYSTAAGVAKPDQDYYRITANPGDRISIDVVAVGSAVDTDTVLEVLDTFGYRLSDCRVPQGTQFTSSCLNDDLLPGVVTNSHLDVQLTPAANGGNGQFVVHVLDWAGRARPEMTYDIKLAKLP